VNELLEVRTSMFLTNEDSWGVGTKHGTSNIILLEDTTLPKVFALLDFFNYGYDLFHHPATGVCDADNSPRMVEWRRAAAKEFLQTFQTTVIIEGLRQDSLRVRFSVSKYSATERRALGEASWEWNRRYYPRPDLILKLYEYQLKYFRRLTADTGLIQLGWV
jgi:hypothetical protein